MKKPRKITSLVPNKIAPRLLILFVFIFLLQTLSTTWPNHLFSSVIVVICVGGICVFLYQSDWKNQSEVEKYGINKSLISFFAVCLANWMTLILYNSLGISAVIASALVGLAGGMLFPAYSVAIFCGSFVGMSSQAILADIPTVLLSSMIAGAVYVMSEYSLNGIGGKLGTIAFIGSSMTAIIFRLPFLSASFPSPEITGVIVVVSGLAALITWVLGNHAGFGAVIASSVVGLAGGIVMPLVWPEYGELIAVAIFCASFAGMSSRARFSWVQMVSGGLLCCALFAASMQVFGGAGGKLGMTAFSASIAVLGYQYLFDRK